MPTILAPQKQKQEDGHRLKIHTMRSIPAKADSVAETDRRAGGLVSSVVAVGLACGGL